MENSSNVLPAPLVVKNSGRWLGNDGAWSTFSIHVGTPPQLFYVLPSFAGQALYVPEDDDCLPGGFNVTNCGQSRGSEVFATKPGVGFRKNSSSSWYELGKYKVQIGPEYGLVGNAIYGLDTISPLLDGDLEAPTLQQQAVASYATGDLWVGRLGLSMFALEMSQISKPQSFLSRLKEEGYIPSLSFGYQAGAAYQYTKVPGSLTLGGYDRSRSSERSLLFTSSEGHIVGLQSITAKLDNGTVVPILERGILASIDPDVPELWLPPSLCDLFAATFGLTFHPEAQRYVVNDTAHAQLLQTAPVFRFTLGTSTAGGETIDIVIPYSAFNLQASYPIFASTANYFPLRRAADADKITLGRVFLQEVYMTVDWERDTFNLSQAVFNATMAEPDIVPIRPVNFTNPSEHTSGPTVRSGKLSAGMIGGIVAGAVVLLMLGFGVWFCMRRRAQKGHTSAINTQLPDGKPDYSYFAPEVAEKLSAVAMTDLELEGRVVGELAAPYERNGVGELERKEIRKTNAAELDCRELIYELPSHN